MKNLQETLQRKQREFLNKFTPDFLTCYEDWINAQFADWYNPSDAAIRDFMFNTLAENVEHYDLSFDITWYEFLNEWEINEPFMDYFGD